MSAVAHHDAAHGSLKSYTAGLVLSLALTAASFAAGMSDALPPGWGLPAIVALCVIQLLVQLVYFLHMGAARSQRQNTGIFLCTAFLVAIVVAGSLWVMHNANENMMPNGMAPVASLRSPPPEGERPPPSGGRAAAGLPSF